MKKTELSARSSREPLYGVNPVLEALRGNRKIDEIVVAEGAHHDRLRELIDLARAKNIPVSRAPRAALDRAARNANHQGVLARVAAARYADADELLDSVAARVGTRPEPLVVVLDGVEDPRNLGAILRTVECAGVDATARDDTPPARQTPDNARVAAPNAMRRACSASISAVPQ